MDVSQDGGTPTQGGAVADKSLQLVLTALSRAAAAGAPLHGGKAAPGLFPATAAGKQAAQRCRDEGYLHPVAVPAPARTRSAKAERWAITDKGLAYLLTQVSPRPVLEDLVRALEARHGQLAELLALARQSQADVEAMKARAEKVLAHVGAGEPPAGPAHRLNALYENFRGAANGQGDTLPQVVLGELSRWAPSGASEDCPLPELFRRLRAQAPGLTLGAFHDALRQLHDAGQVYLHPWTGPLYDVPEPACALLVGHVIAYYASKKEG
jgi:hypothetical protein